MIFVVVAVVLIPIFQGLSFHTNSWPDDFNCAGKRLAVIGKKEEEDTILKIAM